MIYFEFELVHYRKSPVQQIIATGAALSGFFFFGFVCVKILKFYAQKKSRDQNKIKTENLFRVGQIQTFNYGLIWLIKTILRFFFLKFFDLSYYASKTI